MNIKCRTIPALEHHGKADPIQTIDVSQQRPNLHRILIRCVWCSPPRVRLNGRWVPLPGELAGESFTDGICPLHLANMLSEIPA